MKYLLAAIEWVVVGAALVLVVPPLLVIEGMGRLISGRDPQWP